MTTESKVNKGVVTYLDIRLMPEKTVRDMWTNFFKGNVPAGFFGETRSMLMFRGSEVPRELYELIVREHGTESPVLKVIECSNYTSFDTKMMRQEIYKVIPFVCRKGDYTRSILSDINRWSLETRLDRTEYMQIQIETRSYSSATKEEDIKDLNKENARRLRKYLVGLPSVQGVPYSCTYKDDVETEKSCEV